jgi:hypothetical protein
MEKNVAENVIKPLGEELAETMEVMEVNTTYTKHPSEADADGDGE